MSDLNTNNGLHLKYRPTKFKDVAGHKAEVKQLQNMVEEKRIPSAIAFIGRSGTGKTTLARMLARYLNCEKGTSCGKCESCKSMDAPNNPDYNEVNAAKESGKGDIENLIQQAQYAPLRNIRIIMIDEVHKLTNHAVNCLLKPMEEPPSKTLYIIATSEPDAISNGTALLGRCQVFNLSPPTVDDISERIQTVAKKEKFKWVNDKIAEKIASTSGGQVRDALQLLDRMSNYANSLKKDGKVKEKALIKEIGKVIENTGQSAVDKVVSNLITSMYLGDAQKVHRTLMDIEEADTISIVTSMIYANMFLLHYSTGTTKHKKMWYTPVAREILKTLQKAKCLPDTTEAAYVMGKLKDLKKELFQFQSDPYVCLVSALPLIADWLAEDEE